MTTLTTTPPWPLSSEDGDWYALDGSWTRHEAAREIAYNLRDWFLDDFVYFDDDDTPLGWVRGYRDLLSCLSRGFVRPYEAGDDDWEAVEEPGWWFECETDHPLAVACWIWKR